MKKATYKIRMKAGEIETRAGYIEKICGYYIGVCKEDNTYKTTELYTGEIVNRAKTRAAAIEGARNIIKEKWAINEINTDICFYMTRGGLLNVDVIKQYPEKLTPALIRLYSIGSINDLKKYSFSLSDYDAARDLFIELYQTKEAKTFLKPVADFFEACGLQVVNVSGVYCITL